VDNTCHIGSSGGLSLTGDLKTASGRSLPVRLLGTSTTTIDATNFDGDDLILPLSGFSFIGNTAAYFDVFVASNRIELIQTGHYTIECTIYRVTSALSTGYTRLSLEYDTNADNVYDPLVAAYEGDVTGRMDLRYQDNFSAGNRLRFRYANFTGSADTNFGGTTAYTRSTIVITYWHSTLLS
jgi:hypothetical protein